MCLLRVHVLNEGPPLYQQTAARENTETGGHGVRRHARRSSSWRTCSPLGRHSLASLQLTFSPRSPTRPSPVFLTGGTAHVRAGNLTSEPWPAASPLDPHVKPVRSKSSQMSPEGRMFALKR